MEFKDIKAFCKGLQTTTDSLISLSYISPIDRIEKSSLCSPYPSWISLEAL